ncbi:MAG: hypothetical protein JWQ87_3330 [Candidatus Sulfotelmatobacter sp.]|nr:hypothetical protein [Candidatus Sulfotelmatobacter sp.]
MSTVPSITIITNLKNLTSSTTNSLKSGSAEGIDMPGMLALALSKATELKVCLTLITRAIDGADPNSQTLTNILASLS